MGDITDPVAFNDFLDSLPIISKEPAVATIAPNTLPIPEHFSGGATVMMVSDSLPPLVAALKRSSVD